MCQGLYQRYSELDIPTNAVKEAKLINKKETSIERITDLELHLLNKFLELT